MPEDALLQTDCFVRDYDAWPKVSATFLLHLITLRVPQVIVKWEEIQVAMAVAGCGTLLLQQHGYDGGKLHAAQV
jgi:hypothetical protein